MALASARIVRFKAIWQGHALVCFRCQTRHVSQRLPDLAGPRPSRGVEIEKPRSCASVYVEYVPTPRTDCPSSLDVFCNGLLLMTIFHHQYPAQTSLLLAVFRRICFSARFEMNTKGRSLLLEKLHPLPILPTQYKSFLNNQ